MDTDKSGDKSRKVREMFGAIAGRYDFLNHFLSANIDRRWRRVCVREVRERNRVRDPKILDLGCGTADLSIAFSDLGSVFGCDFSRPMLEIGIRKIKSEGLGDRISLMEADALNLPFAEGTFDIVASAFVFRNLADIGRGFRESRRILRPGGLLSVLDFGMPKAPVLAPLYRLYFQKILPRIGKFVSGESGPYGYLPDSVQTFPSVEKLKEIAESNGFCDVDCRRLSAGIAVLLTGRADTETPPESAAS